MGEGLTAGTIVSYDGSTPGIMEGLNGNLPAAGYVPGDLYLTTDTAQIYRWDGFVWTSILTGGGGGGITGDALNKFIAVGTGPTSITHSLIQVSGANLLEPLNLLFKRKQIVVTFFTVLPTIVNTDNIILVDTSGGSVTIDIDHTGMYDGQTFTVKKFQGAAATTVTLNPGALHPIDTGATFILPATKYCACTFFYNGTNSSFAIESIYT